MKFLQHTSLLLLFTVVFAMSPKEYMDKLRNDVVTPEPNGITNKVAGVDYGQIKAITYRSKAANRDKRANVILPAGYGSGEKFPVLYVNHGVFGSENDMLGGDFGLQIMSANLAAKGEAEKMIIVTPNMWTSKTDANPPGFTFNNEVMQCYDDFLDDITDSLIPYMEQNFDVKTGRDNTAITGFSMGGREGIYIGISRPDIFGYIGGACPAPGIVPAVDAFMQHKGSMTESEFKIKDTSNLPYILFITGGDNDSVVGTFPKQYSDLFTKNGCDHVFQLVPGGIHGGNSVRAHLYNFLRYVFRADKN